MAVHKQAENEIMLNTRLKGNKGEDEAVDFLIRQGYKIIERNFRNRYGEVDIVAMDGSDLCFVEVKSRSTDLAGSPWDAVSKSKQRQIIRAAKWYLMEKELADIQVRFDVVAVEYESEKITVLKNAFDTGGQRR